VVKVTTGCMGAAHGGFIGICQVAPVCIPPNTCFLGPPESTTETASRSVQPFLHSSGQGVAIHRVKWRHISVVAIRSPFCWSTPSYCA